MCDFSDPRKMTNTFLAVIEEEINKYIYSSNSNWVIFAITHVFRFHPLISGWPIIEKWLHKYLGLHDSLPVVLNFLLLLKYLNIWCSRENK